MEESGVQVDVEGFNKAMEVQRVTARTARKETNYMGADANVYQEIDPSVTTVFVGYENHTHDSIITVLTTQDAIVDTLCEGEQGTIFVEETPFYATSGGQEADTGIISSATGTFKVQDTIKLLGGKFGHVGIVTSGEFKVGSTVTLTIDEERRALTGRNHSATHLLQKALKMVLGNHVEQSGSSVNKDRLRFDFTHFNAMTKEEIAKVEELVNQQISSGISVRTDIMSIEDAKKTGAMALFGEKYGDSVRVVSMGDFSKELCGGTHVKNTNEISTFKIISEAGVAANVRRIEALTSDGAFDYYKNIEAELFQAAKTAKTEPQNLTAKIQSMLDEIKMLTAENNKLKDKVAKDSMGDVMSNVIEVKGVKVLPVSLKDVDMNSLRNLGDQLKEKLGSGVVVLASEMDGKVNLIAMVTDDVMKQGAHAGNLIKEIASLVGGGGGGRPNMAQAGGKNPAGIRDALEKAIKVVEQQIN